jgi:citrate synthase
VPGSRARRYRRSDVERLAARARRAPIGTGPEIVVDTAITRLDPAGRLAYRGWDATRAAVDAHYEEVAAWLWGAPAGTHEHWLPDPDALALARAVVAVLPREATAGDRLRVMVAALRPLDPLRDDRRVTSVAARARTLLATLVEALPPVDERSAQTVGGPLAARLWTRLSPLEPTRRRVRALDRALSLLADHELAISTVAVRVAASGWADPYLLLLTGLAVVAGPLHGGASERVRSLLRDALQTSPAAAVGRVLADVHAVPGFGHAVYEGPDPRTAVLLDAVDETRPPRHLAEVVDGIRGLVAGDDGPYPNVDFALGVFAEAGRMIDGAGEAIFAIARCAGWIAHGLEEYPYRLRYRVRAAYTAPDPE